MSKEEQIPKGYQEIPKPENAKVDEWFNPKKEGESVQGEITSIEEGQYGKFFIVKTKDGKIYGMPSHKSLQAYIPLLKVGDKVLVKFENFYKTSNGTGNNYRVFKE